MFTRQNGSLFSLIVGALFQKIKTCQRNYDYLMEKHTDITASPS